MTAKSSSKTPPAGQGLSSPNTRKKLRILCLFGDGGRYAGQVNRAATHSIHFHKYFFDDYMSLDSSGLLFTVNRKKLAQTVEAVFSGRWDAISCDANDAILLQFFASERGLPTIPFIINEVDLLESAVRVNNFIRTCYGQDFISRFTGVKTNYWMTVLKSRVRKLNLLGIPKPNIFYLPVCTPVIEFTFPRFFSPSCRTKNQPAMEMANKIIAPGTHNRDFNLLAKAAAGTGLEIHIITNLKINKPMGPPELVWHDSLPEPVFLQVLANARFIIVTLLDSNRAAGQLACAVPMKFGRPVLSANCDSISDHIVNGKTGLLYETGNSISLRNAMLRLAKDQVATRRMGNNAQAREAALSETAAVNIKRLLDALRTK